MPGEGEDVTARGTASIDTGAKPNANEPFRISSITKPFIAATIPQLVDESNSDS